MLPFPEAAIEALARAPEARLLRRLEIVYDMRLPPVRLRPVLAGPNRALMAEDEGETTRSTRTGTIMPPLIASPYLTNLRVFKLGFSDDDRTRSGTARWSARSATATPSR